jgi:arginyl-tRNA synthetase
MTYFLDEIQQKLALDVSSILGIGADSVTVQVANEKIGSDLAVPCFAFAGELSKSPQEIAQQVADSLDFPQAAEVSAINGFLNVWLKPKVLAEQVAKNFHASTNYGDNSRNSGQVVVTEYTDPNPFKPLHIGHAYSNTVGESISRLYESSGAEVHRVTYHGDVGLHVAKAIWGIQKELETNGWQMADVPEEVRTDFLGNAYVVGAGAYKNDDQAKQEIIAINKKVYDKSDEEINEIYKNGHGWSFAGFEDMYRKLGVSFEKGYLESQTVDIARQTVAEGLAKGVFEVSDGATVFKGEKYGLHTRVFISSQGIPIYEAKDLGLAHLKHDDFKYNASIILTGNEQDQYFEVVLKALELLRPDLAEATTHMSHGMVRFADGKMSSRSGNAINADSLIVVVEDALNTTAPDSPSIKENALAAIKFAFLKQGIGGDIIFDIKQSISLEGNSGPYVQYAAVRVGSILAKAEITDQVAADYDFEDEKELLMLLARYPGIVSEALTQLAPHMITGFSFELAKAWNRYYEKVQILGGEDEQIRNSRLKLLEQIYRVFEHSLGLLGITVPEKM